MHLLIISGFLGSGKTTILIKLAQLATQKGLRVAILVNEIGEIGIDDQLMRQLDLNVWELLNGCICCSLSKDLPATLQKIADGYSPDFILLEPSGAADLENVLSSLKYYRGSPLQSRRTAVIIDPLRLEKLIKVMTPLITSQIKLADIILINKMDVASDTEMNHAKTITTEFNSGNKIFCISAKDQLEPDVLLELLP